MRLSIILAVVTACVPPPTPNYYPPAQGDPAPAQGYAAPQAAPQNGDDPDDDRDDGEEQPPPQRTPQSTTAPRATAPRPRSITINGAQLTQARAQTLARLEAQAHGSLPDGAYWYDKVNGAAGAWGQPGAALLQAGLDLGPPLPSNASNGTSGVYINNRQLQSVEVQFLSALVGVQWQPGRYFIDAQGNAGLEGGGVLVNLVQAAQQRQAAAGGGNNGRQDVSFTFGAKVLPTNQQSHFFSSADGSCKTFNSPKGTIFVGC
jgi:hypothetical protein